MKLEFPSTVFDDAVSAVCHGSASDEQMRALNEVLRRLPSARDEYILRVELHSRLASDPELFLDFAMSFGVEPLARQRSTVSRNLLPTPAQRRPLNSSRNRILTATVCALFLAVCGIAFAWMRYDRREGAKSTAVAMLNRVVDVHWEAGTHPPRVGSPLEPGRLRLQSGVIQIVFYSGARLVVEGPADLQVISPMEAACGNGRLLVEVPPQAHGFRVGTSQMDVTDLGTVFGMQVHPGQTELHVFKGSVDFADKNRSVPRNVKEGAGALAAGSRPIEIVAADPAQFVSLFALQRKSLAAEALRYDQWREASRQLNADPSLLVHYDFEHATPADWLLQNTSQRAEPESNATIVGCQWVEGRWPAKPALEFRGVSDRVRLNVPGQFDALTASTWVRVQGLDRQFNSLFMSDGFASGTLHWLIRSDGVLGLTVVGNSPGSYQIVASPPVLSIDQFGLWMHLVVVLDGQRQRVVHYVNGRKVDEKPLKMKPPFRVGLAELGNWNASGFPGNDPSLIRNFSGAMDEFCLFGRPLKEADVLQLYRSGKPQFEPVSTR